MAPPVITITRQYASGGAAVAQHPDALHVYVVASKPWRIQLAVERLGVDPANAEKVVDDTDRRRDQYVRTYYGRHRHDVVNYDLVVNTEKLGIEGAAALVVAEARRRQWRCAPPAGRLRSRRGCRWAA